MCVYLEHKRSGCIWWIITSHCCWSSGISGHIYGNPAELFQGAVFACCRLFDKHLNSVDGPNVPQNPFLWLDTNWMNILKKWLNWYEIQYEENYEQPSVCRLRIIIVILFKYLESSVSKTLWMQEFQWHCKLFSWHVILDASTGKGKNIARAKKLEI